MRASDLRLVTLREPPADAVALHERLLRRAGFVRKVEGGVYFLLPLGARVLGKMVRLLEAEFADAGYQQVVPPLTNAVQEVLEAARSQVRSWRSLPLGWYWVGAVRDEAAEPRGGLIHTREWYCLRAWAFDAERAAAEESARALATICSRALGHMGLEALPAQGDGWHVVTSLEGGEDRVLRCTTCSRAFVPEWCPVMSAAEEPVSADSVLPAEAVSTPDLRTVEEVARFLGVPASRLVKTLLVEADGKAVAALVRGDHDLSLPKLRHALGVREVQMLSAERVEEVTRAPVGFAGPVGLQGLPLIADDAVRAMQGFVVGANLPDAHRVNVCWGRDFAEPRWADLRTASSGDRCAFCGGELAERWGILLASVQPWAGAESPLYDDAQGHQQSVIITQSALNLTRTLAVLVEASHDADGIVWHPRVAPYEAVVLLLNPSEEEHRRVAERVTEQLRAVGMEVLLDDRDERAGAKFKDADLIGIPVQVVVGRSVAEGTVELRLRRDRNPHRVTLEDCVIAAQELLHQELGGGR